VRAFRDKALIDRDDQSCGIIDDINTEEREPGVWQLTALLVGPGVWHGRRPRWFTALLPGHQQVRIDAANVARGNQRRAVAQASRRAGSGGNRTNAAQLVGRSKSTSPAAKSIR
jgi:hypothetical protein